VGRPTLYILPINDRMKEHLTGAVPSGHRRQLDCSNVWRMFDAKPFNIKETIKGR